ncbi:MAG: hypothetical protein RL174_953 [Actinomycetota bacterium]
MKKLAIVAALAATLLTLTACAGAPASTSGSTESSSASPTSGTEGNASFDSSKIQIVASTNIWGSVASSVGGDLVQVTSIIDTASQDPHSYEASARDQLAFKQADLVITNGGGYDDFAAKLAESATDADKITIADIADATKNEHLWYSVSAVGQATYAIADELGKIDGANKETYLANADKFIEGLTGIAAGYGEIQKKAKGKKFFATEPVANLMLSDLGFVDATPAEFSKAIENETDVPPLAMNAALELIGSGKINVVVLNAQTENTQTKQIADKAKSAGVAVVTLSELMPKGMAYIDWMGENLIALDKALG